MKIVIINDVHVGKPLMHGDKARSSSEVVMNMFESFLQDLVIRHRPDLVINMGDLIRSETSNVDLDRYHKLMSQYSLLQIPVVHLIGNHEIKRLQFEDIEAAWRSHGFEQDRFGLRSFGDVDVIWLGIDQEEKGSKNFILPPKQLAWLKQTLNGSTKQTLIFIHCPIDDQDVSGNFFYEFLDGRKKDGLFLKNQNAVRELIQARQNVIAVFQAHLHYFHARILDGISYITCPAMNDNICGPHVVNNNPEVYTVVTIEEDFLVAKAYSGEHCFAGFERSLSKQL